MDLYLDDRYPADAAFGADFLTNTAQGEVVMEGPDGPIVRPERIVITTRQLDDQAAYGRICIGERTARHFAHLFDMVDGWRVKRIVDDNEALRAELVQLSEELAAERRTVAFLRELEASPRGEVFVALDGSHHESKRACIEASAQAVKIDSKAILGMVLPTVEPQPGVPA